MLTKVLKIYFYINGKQKRREWQYEPGGQIGNAESGVLCMLLFTPEQAKQNKEIWDWKEIRHYMPLKAECFESIYLGVNIEQTEKEKNNSTSKTLNPRYKDLSDGDRYSSFLI